MTQTYNTTKALIINAPIPQETKTYKPVEHERLIDLTLNGIHSAGFKLATEDYTMALNGAIANGKFAIQNIADAEMQLQIGWQNSYNKSLTLKFAIGTKIFICQNGCVSGDFGTFKKKHVGEIQTFTPAAITDYIKSAGDTFQRMQIEREAMKTVSITKRTTAELIGRMMIEDSIIASTQVNIIKNELTSPTHDYGAANSMWELYQYSTYAMKELHPADWMKKHMQAHQFFVNEAGIYETN
jgi:hypothetical protein